MSYINSGLLKLSRWSLQKLSNPYLSIYPDEYSLFLPDSLYENILSTVPTSPPTGLTAVGGACLITLSWVSVSGAISYDLQRSAHGANTWTAISGLLPGALVNTGLSSYADLSGLPPMSSYDYQIRVTTITGISAWSATVTAAAATPTAWLKGDAGTYSDTGLSTATIIDGTTIKGWKDQSGNGNNFTNSAGPVLKNGIQNSLPILRFNGTSQYLLNSTAGTLFQGSNPASVVLAGSQVSAGSETVLSWNTSTQNNDYGYIKLRDTSQTPNCQGTIRTQSPVSDAQTSDKLAIGSAFSIAKFTYSSGGITQVQSNGDVGTSGTTLANVLTINQVVIGAIVRPSNSSGVLFFGGDIGEIMLYNFALSSLEQIACGAYLNSRWALGIAAPSIPSSLATTALAGILIPTYGSTTTAGCQIKRSISGTGMYYIAGQSSTTSFYDRGNDPAKGLGLPGTPGTWDYQIAAIDGLGQMSTFATLTGQTTYSGALDPTKIEQQILQWLDADTQGGSNGSTPATFTDQSSAGHNATAVNSPTVVTGAVDGRRAWNFASASSQYATADPIGLLLSGTQIPRTIFHVSKHSTLTAQQCTWMYAQSHSNNQTNDHLFDPQTANCWMSAARNDVATLETINGYGDADTNYHLHASYMDGTNDIFYLDGTLSNRVAHMNGQMTCELFTWAAHRRAFNTGQPTLDTFLDGRIASCGIYSVSLLPFQNAFLSSWAQTRFPSLAVGAPFNPMQTGQCIAYYRDDSIFPNQSQSQGTTVSTWNTKTGGNANGGGSTSYDLLATSTPTYDKAVAVLNNHDAVTVSNGKYYTCAFTPPLISGTSIAFEIWGVAKATGLGVTQTIWSFSNGGSSNAYINMRISSGNAYQIEQRNDTGIVTTLTGGIATTNPFAWRFVFDGANGMLFINSSQVVTGALSGGAMTLTTSAVGCLLRNVASESFTGDVTEFGPVLGNLSASNVTTWQNYQHTRFGLPSS